MNKSLQRLASIDWIRGVAAFLVLGQHTCENIFPMFKAWTLNNLNFGMSGVVAFFLVSGYIMLYSVGNKNVRDFLIGRFFRIFPLYWTVLALGTLTYYPHIEVSALIAHIIPLQDYVGFPSYVGGGVWTLLLELVFYLLFIVWYKQFSQKKWHIPIFSFVVVSMLILLGIWTQRRMPLGRPLLILAAFQSALEYGEKSNKMWYLQSLIVGAGLVYFAVYIGNPIFSGKCILLSWLLGYIIFFLFRHIRIHGRMAALLSWMGKISYSVYLGQALILIWMAYFNMPHYLFALAIPLTYAFAVILYTCIEQPGIWMGRSVIGQLKLRSFFR